MRSNLTLPVEVCELIIDLAYDHDVANDTDHELATRTMNNCALVCHTWQARSRNWIFHAVRLGNIRALRQFSSHLNQLHTLAPLVHKLYVVGGELHAPSSAVTALPIELGRRLPNLTSVFIIRALNPQAPEHVQGPMLPHLPIHPRFPLSFGSFAGLDDLHLEGVVFPSFTDFVRCLRSVGSTLSGLACIRVRWSAPSMTSSSHQVRPFCLSKLKRLTVSATTGFESPSAYYGSHVGPVHRFV